MFDETYIEIKDIQTWDDDIPYVQQSTIVPGIMADLVQSRAQLTLEQMEGGEKDGEGCMHKLSGECNVGIPFLGYYVEQAIIANMKEFYAGYARHIDGFVDMVVRRFGDGSMASLRMAVDRLVAEEKG